jgi:hypothetical protein
MSDVIPTNPYCQCLPTPTKNDQDSPSFSIPSLFLTSSIPSSLQSQQHLTHAPPNPKPLKHLSQSHNHQIKPHCIATEFTNTTHTDTVKSRGGETSNCAKDNQSINHITGEELEPTIHPQPPSLLHHPQMMLPTNTTMLLITQLVSSLIQVPD